MRPTCFSFSYSGMIFRYPGDPRKLREKSKMKLWKDYLSSES